MIMLFLDIDGVFSIAASGVVATKMPCGIWAWPVPLAHRLLYAINQDEHISPVWLSAWGSAANDWNDLAGIKHWEVGHPLSSEAELHIASLWHPSMSGLTGKPRSIQYYKLAYPDRQMVWIEDGFSPGTEIWAKQAGVRLVDTTKKPLCTWLLHLHDLLDNNAIVEYLTKGQEE